MTKRKDGRWYERVTINGKTKHIYGKTKAEVFRKIRELEDTIIDGTKFEAVANEWWEAHEETIAYNTAKGYKPAINRAVKVFGERQIKAITPKDIDKLIYNTSRLFAEKTVKTQKLVLNLIFSYAVVQGYADVNPVREIKIPDGLRREKRKAPLSDDIAKVKKAVNEDFGLFAYMALYTGMRRGELLALEWKDINIEERTISVNKSVYYIDNAPHIKKPKTETSIGVLPILDALLPHLHPKKGLVFPNEKGELMLETQFRKKWAEYTAANEITATPHQFRHAYATMLYEAGVLAQDAQHLLRHAQIQTTIDVYTDLRESKRQEIHKKVYAVDIE